MSTSHVRDIAQYTDCIIFGLLTFVELSLFIKLRFNIDFSAKLTLILYWFASLLRVPSDFLFELSTIQKANFWTIIALC